MKRKRDYLLRFVLRSRAAPRRQRNPYFAKTSSRRPFLRYRWRRIIYAALALALLAAASGLSLFFWASPWFVVRDGINYDLSYLPETRQQLIRHTVESALSKQYLFGIERRSFFLINERRLTEMIEKTGVYARVRVEKKFPHQLNIYVRQVEPFFFAKRGEERAVLGERGEVLEIIRMQTASGTAADDSRAASSSALTQIEIEESSSTTRFSIGENILCKNCATLINSLSRGLQAMNITVLKFFVSADMTMIKAVIKDGWKLITDPIATPVSQLERLSAVLREKQYRDHKRIDYIDVRYPDKVFVNFK